MTHAPDEIPVGCGHGPLSSSENSHVTTQTRTTGWGAYGSLCLKENCEQTFIHGLSVNGLGSRNDEAAHPGCYPAAFQQLSSQSQILNAAIGTGADHYLINGNLIQG